MPPGVDDAHGLLRELVEAVVERQTTAAHRLGSAKTSIRFRVGDDDDASFVLLADRRPPIVVDVDEPAEVELRLSVAQAAALAAGTLVTPIEIMASNVEYDGPVRKYLDIDPILRALLAPEESR